MTRSIKVTVVSARNLLNKDGGIGRKKSDVSDPYCFIIFQGTKKNTKVIEDDLNPVWNETFEFPLEGHLDMGSQLEIKCYDQDIGRDESLGIVQVPLGSLRSNPVLEDWFSLHHKKDKNKEWQGEVKLRIEYKSGETDASSGADAGLGQDSSVYADVSAEGGVDSAAAAAAAAGTGAVGAAGAAGDGATTLSPAAAADAEVETSIPRIPRVRSKLSARKQNFQVRVHIVQGRALQGTPVKIDPIVKLSVSGKKAHTKVRKKTVNPQFDELFYFDFFESPRNLFDRVICLDVMNAKTLRSDSLIGSFRLDVATVYAQKNHSYYRQWLMLYVPTDIGRGAQGYLQVTMAVLGPGDKMVIPDDYDELDPADVEDADDRILGPSRVSREPAVMTVKIFQAEDLPQMDPNWETGFKPFDKLTRQEGKEQCDPFVEVCYAGCKRKTQHMDNTFTPEWNQAVKIPMPLPALCNTVKIHVYDKDTAILLNPDDLIGTALIPLNEISNFAQEGFLPTFGPAWVTLYGSPRHFKSTPGPKAMRHYEKMNAGVIPGCAYRGRVLLEIKAGPAPVAETAVPGDAATSASDIPKAPFAVTPGDVQRAAPNLSKRPFKLRVQLLSVNKMLENLFEGDEIRVEVSIGTHGLASKNSPGCVTALLQPAQGGRGNYYLDFGDQPPVLSVTSLWDDKAAQHARVYNVKHKVVADLRNEIENTKPHDSGEVLALAMLLAERLDAAPTDIDVPLSDVSVLDVHFKESWKRDIAIYKQEAQRILTSSTTASPQAILDAVVDVTDALEASVTSLQRNALPDVVITLCGSKIGDDRAFCRIPACDLLYAEKESQRGRLWGKEHSTLLHAVVPDGDDHGRVIAQIQARAWLSYEEEAELVMPAIQACRQFRYQLRAHVYQARDLLAADDNGLSDPYCVVTCGTKAQRTHIVKETRSPFWDEVVILDDIVVYAADEAEAIDALPDVVVEVFDHDRFGDEDFLGKFVAQPILRSASKTLPAILAWQPVTFDTDKAIGHVLCAFELIPMSDVASIPLPKPVTTKEDMTGDSYSCVALPVDIRPETELCQVDILAFGLRNLKRVQLLTVNSPHVEFECMGQLVLTEPLQDVTKDPNFRNRLLSCEVDLPVKQEYLPPLNIKVYDNRKFGRKVLVGTHSITTLRDYYHSAEELETLAKSISHKNLLPSSQAMDIDQGEVEMSNFADDGESDNRPLLAGPSSSAATKDVVIDIPEEAIPEPNEGAKEKIKEQEDEMDWWSKFYASIGHPGGQHYPKDADTITVYKSTLEEAFNEFKDCCSTYPLHRGDANDDDRELVGLLKGSFYARPISTNHLTPPWDHITDAPVTRAMVRVYVIRAMQLKPSDPNGKSDPYIKIRIGDREIEDQDDHHEDTLDPIFGKCYELEASLPLDQQLEISVMDHDLLGNDDLIGQTVIDLENRWLSLKRGTCGLPQTYDVQTWRDVNLPSTILRTWCSRNSRAPPEIETLEPYGVTAHVGDSEHSDRFVVKDKAGMNAAHLRENACLMALHHIGLVPEHVETRTLVNPMLEDSDQGSIQLWVDILPLNAGPLRPPVNVKPREPTEYELRVVIWDVKNAVLEETAITGEKMSDLFVRGYMEGQEDDKQDTDVHYRSLNGEGNFNWRMKFPLRWLPGEDVLVVDQDSGLFSFGSKPDPRKLKPILHMQLWDNDSFSRNDYIGHVDIDLTKVTPAPGRRWALTSTRNNPVSLFKVAKDSNGSGARLRGWFKCVRDGNDDASVGRIDMEIELLTKEEASRKENGLGRDEPNAYPKMEPPKRPDTSFFWLTSPWKVARYVIWKNYKWRIIGLFCLAVLIVGLYYLFTEFPQAQVQNWMK